MGQEIVMSGLVRKDDWRARFAAEVDRIKRTPFAWGSHDCGPGLAGNLVYAVTGVDCAAQWRGEYDDALGAARAMRDAGFDNLADLVGSMLPEYEHPSQARIADVAAIKVDSVFGYALGVIDYERVFVLTENGIGTIDRSEIARAFKVG
ncbi:hypothetical protein G6M84_10395 [Agrobacterium tumefaciens]|uniref:DUF6950 family protein n=2 Tax=Agrobacterium tumefaciens TaxID=358 RepID=UPI001D547C6B|nr:hypothetical protein [Agrobacterium tumefaciens]NTB96926.1 hypothetical protein [Agrobacterium tumefaciens]NTC44160.1 hypothetical protein [Agrobacterium tumefaciens]